MNVAIEKKFEVLSDSHGLNPIAINCFPKIPITETYDMFYDFFDNVFDKTTGGAVDG